MIQDGLNKWGGTLDTVGSGSGFFRVEKIGARWWFVDPDGHAFFSLGLNHIEEADLKYPGNVEVWESKYGSSRDRWMTSATSDLRRLGFNTLGWTQQWIAGDYVRDVWNEPVDLLHSSGWTPYELRAAGMPYVQVLPFAQFQGWNAHPVYPDVFSREFADFCDFIARAICMPAKDDPNLIGYFFQDVPCWGRHRKSGTFFAGVDDSSYRQVLDVASKYYEVAAAAIRRVDVNHLIFGDRFNGNLGIEPAALAAAGGVADALAVQWFPTISDGGTDAMCQALTEVYASTGKPILNPDAGNNTATATHQARPDALPNQAARGAQYAETLKAIAAQPWCIGWHWCGYIDNPVRGAGIKSPVDEDYEDLTTQILRANSQIYAFAQRGERSTLRERNGG